MRERPDLTGKSSEGMVLYPGIKDPLYAYVFLHLIIKSCRYCDIDYTKKYTTKTSPNKKQHPTGIMIAALLTHKLLNHRPSRDPRARKKNKTLKDHKPGKKIALESNISYTDLKNLFDIFMQERVFDQDMIGYLPKYLRDFLHIDKDGKAYGASNIMQLTLLNDNIAKSNSKTVVKYNQSFFAMSGYKGGKEIKKKIDRFLQKKYHSKERKPSMSAKAIVYDVFEKIIISLTPSGFSEQEVLLYFLSMVDTICLYTKNEETNYLNKRRNMTTKYEKLFNGELPEEHISQATNILGQETRNMTKEILKTHKISIEKYLFLA